VFLGDKIFAENTLYITEVENLLTIKKSTITLDSTLSTQV
jgi:hypothetical protein